MPKLTWLSWHNQGCFPRLKSSLKATEDITQQSLKADSEWWVNYLSISRVPLQSVVIADERLVNTLQSVLLRLQHTSECQVFAT